MRAVRKAMDTMSRELLRAVQSGGYGWITVSETEDSKGSSETVDDARQRRCDEDQQSVRERQSMASSSTGKQSLRVNQESGGPTRDERQQWMHENEASDEPEPWKKDRYQCEQSSRQDLWDLSQRGWAIRVHRHSRTNPFHPVHRSTPVDIKQLEPMRVTHQILERGANRVFDKWTDPKTARNNRRIDAGRTLERIYLFQIQKPKNGHQSRPTYRDV